MVFGSTVLEVAIGMIFVYLLLSLLCSAIGEYIEAWFNFRARDLRKGIELLLNDTAGGGQDLADRLYRHGLIRPLYRDAKKLPSYIPARTFALALWNMAGGGPGGGTADLTKLKAVIDQVPNKELKEALTTLIDEANGDFEQARKNIEDWYDGAMDRVSGWYKRRVQVMLLIIGVAAAAAINADSINIGRALTQDGTLRQSVVGAAEKAVAAPSPTPGQPAEDAAAQLAAAKRKVQDARAQLNELGLPLGWVGRTADNTLDLRRVPESRGEWVLKIFGLLLTGLAISQGAPFWFDLLNKFMIIRSTVKPHEKSREQPSKDKPAPETEETRREEDGQ